MSDNLIEQLTGKGEEDAAEEVTSTGYVPYASIRQTAGYAVWLELRLKTGDSIALRYAYMSRIAFNPSKGITIHSTDGTVQIQGSSLKKLHALLLRDKVTFIQQHGQDTKGRPGDGEPYVSEMVFEGQNTP